MTEKKQITTYKPLGVWPLLFVCLLASSYLLQILSPLRINTDSYRLLSMAVSAFQGEGYLVDGHPDPFPEGYPLVVTLLLATGLASSMTLILLNLACLFIGLGILWAWSKYANGPAQAILPILLVLSSWVMVKHITLPLTDVVYFGISWTCLFFLWMFYHQEGRSKWWWFAASIPLAYLAIYIRTIGLTILPALALTALLHREHTPYLGRLLATQRYVPPSVSAFVMLIFFISLAVVLPESVWFKHQFVRHGSYFQSLIARASMVGPTTFGFRLLEFGEVFTNMPHNRLPQLLPAIYSMGLLVWLLTLYGAFLLAWQKRSLPFVVYFSSYTSLMVVWPFYDARFWLPLLPFLAVAVVTVGKSLETRWQIVRYANRLYLACFLLLGLVAIFNSSRISLSGKEFSEIYGDGSLTMTYRYAFQNGKDVDISKVDARVLRLLGILEPLTVRDHVQEEGHKGARDGSR